MRRGGREGAASAAPFFRRPAMSSRAIYPETQDARQGETQDDVRHNKDI